MNTVSHGERVQIRLLTLKVETSLQTQIQLHPRKWQSTS